MPPLGSIGGIIFFVSSVHVSVRLSIRDAKKATYNS